MEPHIEPKAEPTVTFNSMDLDLLHVAVTDRKIYLNNKLTGIITITDEEREIAERDVKSLKSILRRIEAVLDN